MIKTLCARSEPVVKTRNVTLDYIRGLAIILVVLGHNIQYGSGISYYSSGNYFDNLVFKIIYSFHMPLFAIISGYLLYFSVEKNIVTFIKSKICSLLIPIVSWKTLEYLGKSAYQIVKSHSFTAESFVDYFISLFTSFWFLWATFICSFFIMIIEKKLKGNVYVWFMSVAIMFFVPDYLNFHLYAFLYPCFLVGYFFNKYNGSSLMKKCNKKILLSLLVILYCFMMLFFNRDTYIYISHISILKSDSYLYQLAVDMFRWVIGIIGSSVIIISSIFICRKFSNAFVRLIAYLGRLSLGIYILNIYFVTYILLRATSSIEPNLWIWFVETIIGLVIYVVTINIIKCFPILNRFFLGAR